MLRRVGIEDLRPGDYVRFQYSPAPVMALVVSVERDYSMTNVLGKRTTWYHVEYLVNLEDGIRCVTGMVLSTEEYDVL